MTLTPTLDKANADYFGGSDKPKKIIWNSGAGCRDISCNSFIDVDGKYTFNIDPLTSMAILENYKIDGFTLGRNNEPMLLLTLREKTLALIS
jgi:hypothetical protein